MPRPLSPVLLLGAGTGEATCGILYLASYLRRNDVEAYVRLWDGDQTDAEITRSVEALLARVKPKLVGISLKWFHHVHRALQIARIVRRVDPTVRIVMGGNSASYWWRELAAYDCIDHVALGDGEAPLLSICRGDEQPLNCVTKDPDGSPRRLPLQYVQGKANTEDIHYSHFPELFLSKMDLHAFSGWVAPGKGCWENCLYCGGARGNQKAAFGRAKPFLRAEENVRRDHAEIAPHTWQVRYDFSGSTADFLQSTWAGVDLSRHYCTYFLWGVAKLELIRALAQTFERVFMVLDIGCFSETQRKEQMGRGLLKPCALDSELLPLIDECRKFPNLDIEISGIAGLPFASKTTLKEEVALAKRVMSKGCVIGYQRLEAQPGALVTEHPARFGMATEAKSFREFLDYFEAREVGDPSVPMLRFLDEGLERAVARTAEELTALGDEHAAKKRDVPLSPQTRLQNTAPSTLKFSLGDWLGSHKAPSKFAKEPVTVVRSSDGTTLSLAPTVQRATDPSVAVGEDAKVMLDGLAAFARPTTISKAVSSLSKGGLLDPDSAFGLIEHLVDGKFLTPS